MARKKKVTKAKKSQKDQQPALDVSDDIEDLNEAFTQLSSEADIVCDGKYKGAVISYTSNEIY